MSDQPSPPAKPKPGSLRDRIAAFEKGGAAAPGPAAPPPPRPKPAGFASWKPKQPSPPSSPSASTAAGADHSSPRAGGMSVSDAKDSIVKGGSLKERMAALQGKGAFGAPPPPAPKPALEKPKWKPPPPVVAAPVQGDGDDGESQSHPVPSVPAPTAAPKPEVPSEEGGEGAAEEGEEQPMEVDPEEEERQRRAAIAARMARLGGAKLGMGPTGMGHKPLLPFKKPSLKEGTSKPDEGPVNVAGVAAGPPPGVSGSEDVNVAETDKSSVIAADAATLVPTEEVPATLPPRKSSEGEAAEYFPARKNSESASLLSVDSADSVPPRSPSSMPVPAVPRRAAPPRKKVSRSPAPPPIEQEEVAEQKEEEDTLLAAEALESQQPAAVTGEEALTEDIPAEIPVVEHVVKTVKSPETTFDHPVASSQPPIVEHQEVPASIEPPLPPQLPVHVQASSEVEMEVLKPAREVEADQVEEEEEEEVARRKRVAEKLAKMGGVNPFTLATSRPQRQTSISSVEAAPVSASPPSVELRRRPSVDLERRTGVDSQRRTSVDLQRRTSDQSQRRTSIGSQSRPANVHSPVESPQRKDSIRKSSVDSLMLSEETPTETLELRSHSPEPITEEGEKRKIETTSNIQEEDENETYDEEHEEPLTRSQQQQTEVEGSQYGTHQLHRRLSTTLSYDQEDDEVGTPPPPPPRVPRRESLFAREYPPRRVVPTSPDDEEEVEQQGHEEEIQTEELEEVGQEDEGEDDGNLAASHLFVPPPRARNRYTEEPLRHDDENEGTDNESVPLPIPHRRSIEAYARDSDGESSAPSTSSPKLTPRPMRNIPPPPARSHLRPGPPSDMGHDSDYDEVLPVRPMRSKDRPISVDAPVIVPPPPIPASPRSVVSPLHHTPTPPHAAPPHRVLPPPPSPTRQPEELLTASLTSSSLSVPSEVLDEEEGDPIDPTFHSPSRRASTINLSSPPALAGLENLTASHFQPPPAPAPASGPAGEEYIEEEVESSKRRTIAERMAKLGGIRFGAAPPVPTRQAPPARREDEQALQEPVVAGEENQGEVGEADEEEEERARKGRIAAKLAGMGGMRIGMMPLALGTVAPQRSHVLRDEDSPAPISPAMSTPPHRAIPFPRAPAPQPHEMDDSGTSEEGVKVEAEESEIEELNYEDAQEETPPPIPTRSSRVAAPSQGRASTESSSSLKRRSTDITYSQPPRPPVPTSLPTRRASVQTTRSARSASGDSSFGVASPVRKSSMTAPKSQAEYVFVDEPQSVESQEVPPHLPPGRRAAAPGRAAPTLPPSDLADSISSQWELPSIPSASLDLGGGDLAMSWTDAGISGAASLPPPPVVPGRSLARQESKLSADELMAIWGRVGVQICEVATALFEKSEKSKKSLIGDGTYAGFVGAVFSEVPNAAPLSSGYGYLIYQQTGTAVQKRASEIMPGDVVELVDAKLKGHKGLQTYTQTVGGGEALLGVVGEFEPKKSKVRLFHANQHVGQQTVESVSYRLEDLKSGTVKVYRVLEA